MGMLTEWFTDDTKLFHVTANYCKKREKEKKKKEEDEQRKP